MAGLFDITGCTDCVDAGRERGGSGLLEHTVDHPVYWNQFNRTLGIEKVHSQTHTTYSGAKYLLLFWRGEEDFFTGTLIRLR